MVEFIHQQSTKIKHTKKIWEQNKQKELDFEKLNPTKNLAMDRNFCMHSLNFLWVNQNKKGFKLKNDQEYLPSHLQQFNEIKSKLVQNW